MRYSVYLSNLARQFSPACVTTTVVPNSDSRLPPVVIVPTMVSHLADYLIYIAGSFLILGKPLVTKPSKCLNKCRCRTGQFRFVERLILIYPSILDLPVNHSFSFAICHVSSWVDLETPAAVKQRFCWHVDEQFHRWRSSRTLQYSLLWTACMMSG